MGYGLVAQSCPILVTPWALAHQAPLSMGFPTQEYWSELPFPFLGELPDPGIEPWSPVLQVVSCIAGGLGSLPTESPGKPSWGWGRGN